MDVRIRPVRSDEGDRLREIAVVAKRHWGYDLERVRAWADMGDFTPDGLRRKAVYVAEVDGEVVAWAAAIDRDEVCWLDDLWVVPARMRQGIGTRLFDTVADHGRGRGAVRMEW